VFGRAGILLIPLQPQSQGVNTLANLRRDSQRRVRRKPTSLLPPTAFAPYALAKTHLSPDARVFVGAIPS
jgi:hypothetical protein